MVRWQQDGMIHNSLGFEAASADICLECCVFLGIFIRFSKNEEQKRWEIWWISLVTLWRLLMDLRRTISIPCFSAMGKWSLSMDHQRDLRPLGEWELICSTTPGEKNHGVSWIIKSSSLIKIKSPNTQQTKRLLKFIKIKIVEVLWVFNGPCKISACY